MNETIELSLDRNVIEKLRALANSSHKSVEQWVTDTVAEASEKLSEPSQGRRFMFMTDEEEGEGFRPYSFPSNIKR